MDDWFHQTPVFFKRALKIFNRVASKNQEKIDQFDKVAIF